MLQRQRKTVNRPKQQQPTLKIEVEQAQPRQPKAAERFPPVPDLNSSVGVIHSAAATKPHGLKRQRFRVTPTSAAAYSLGYEKSQCLSR
jgi:hypothetical protein